MGGGDLNQKKSWHPNTMKNMERVWKAEQKDTEERKRIAELQREINAERSKEDMQKFAEDTGVLKKKDDVKLEWMYKGPSQSVNHEDYLLGKVIDRNFEKQQHELKYGPSTSSQEEEGLPGAVRQAKSSLFSEQVDVARKMHEDPLVAIRQRAVEKAKQLYNNPVKMKKIQKLVSMKESENETCKEKKKKKKKTKKSSKRDDEKLLDAILTKKLKSALKDRELLRKLKKNARKSKSESSSSSESDENHDSKSYIASHNDHRSKDKGTSCDENPHKKVYSQNLKEDRRTYRCDSNLNDSRRKSRSPRPSNSRNYPERSSHSSRKRSRSRSREKEKHYSHSHRKEHQQHKPSSDPNVKMNDKWNFTSQQTNSKFPEKEKSYSSKLLASSDEEDEICDKKKGRRRGSSESDYDSNDDSKHKTKKLFGLMMADGSKPVARPNPIVREAKQVHESPQKPVPWQRKERLKLSDEEKERRRQEMLQNASWRDKEREENVKRHRIEEDRERKQLQENFDGDFARKQFSKAAEQTSIEGRIKSKLNTIQRSKVAMDQNFARR